MVDRINELEKKEQALKTQISTAEIKINAKYSDDEIKEFLMKHKRFEDFSRQDKKKILQLFINKIVVYPENVEIHLNLIDLDGFKLHNNGRDKRI
ncbi:hypothetical protein [Miniphocaeibacter halophilus]|uniref:Uncharacterized protein n=1 Tax=Miniphocaeibacter halophilus TaxID=2931922 RepID=A0AC61MQ43_9FIRM|nr:hypothetical protein [Miniphocaeibacter halophilus]QQK07453.1 hypothetical protein JFY71_09055 [Miniphocaeibacter halophilus]